MNGRIVSFVEAAFENAPRTVHAKELKEELLTNMNEKYNDLLAAGQSEEDAYIAVINGMGDVQELINGLAKEDVLMYENIQKQRQKSALLVSISVGMYIFAVIVAIIVNEFTRSSFLAPVIFLIIAAAATCILVYNALSKPRYIKVRDTVVEDFKEWNTNNKRTKSLKTSLISLMWTIITVVYFIISFWIGNWSVSWIIFLIGAVLTQIINICIQDEKR